MWRQTPGFSQRAAFFAAPVGTAVGPKTSGEKLVYVGQEASRLRFLRIYEKMGNEELDEAFQEQMWFEKGKGLVRLEQKIVTLTGTGMVVPDQKVGGNPSMTWPLVKFTPGR